MQRITLPSFTLTKICDQDDPEAIKCEIPASKDQSKQIYHVKPVSTEIFHGHEQKVIKTFYKYNLLPLVLKKSGVIWEEALVYILSKLESQTCPNMNTFHSIVNDLGVFLKFLEDESIDYTYFPQHKLKRPTYLFNGFLKCLIHSKEMAPSTAKRCMGRVIRFYRWLSKEMLIVPDYPMWEEKESYLSVTDARGFYIDIKVDSTDLAIRASKQNDPFALTIKDGGKLRPLTYREQQWLIDALAHLNNTEMTLVHLLMLTTGARIQTACTLRVRHVRDKFPNGLKEYRLPVGASTGVDNKFDKQMTLHIPIKLYEELKIYSYSDRSKHRRQKAVGGDTEDQYLFLTQQGNPYYRHKAEALSFDPSLFIRHQKRGQTIRVFIRDHIIPYIREKYDKNFNYQIHDLRATYGMNLTDTLLARVERHEIDLNRAREFVKTYMGHERYETTDRYLDYRRNLKMVYDAVDDHEKYFAELIGMALKVKPDED